MDLASRKLAFIQTFLKVQDEVIVSAFEEMLTEKMAEQKNDIQPMSIEQFNKEIQQSIIDSENDNGIDAIELKAEIKKRNLIFNNVPLQKE